MNQLEVVGTLVPGIEQDGARLDSLVSQGVEHHFAEVVILGFAVRSGIINPIINRVELARLARNMH